MVTYASCYFVDWSYCCTAITLKLISSGVFISLGRIEALPLHWHSSVAVSSCHLGGSRHCHYIETHKQQCLHVTWEDRGTPFHWNSSVAVSSCHLGGLRYRTLNIPSLESTRCCFFNMFAVTEISFCHFVVVIILEGLLCHDVVGPM